MDGVTPGMWALGPGLGGWSVDCAAALMACGVDPEGFGTYKERLDAQGLARKELGTAHQSAEVLDDKGPELWLRANSQSGHQCQNACFTKHRHDPCGNYPPTSGDPNAPSAFGYDHDKAPSTDHHGKSSTHGTTHGEISKHLDRQWEGKKTGEPLDFDALKRSTKENAEIHVDCNVQQKDSTKPKKTIAARINTAQQANAERLLKKNPDAEAALAAKFGTEPGSVSDPSNGGPSAAVKDFAAECQAAKWEQDMATMRSNAINASPIAKSSAAKQAIADHNAGKEEKDHIKNFTDLPQDKQKEVVDANRPGELSNDDPPKAPANQNIDPPQKAKGGQGRGKPPNGTPTKADCRAAQGNYLAWQVANSDGNKMPSWSGQVPPRAIEGDATPHPNVAGGQATPT